MALGQRLRSIAGLILLVSLRIILEGVALWREPLLCLGSDRQVTSGLPYRLVPYV